MESKTMLQLPIFKRWSIITILVLITSSIWVMVTATRNPIQDNVNLQAPQVGFIAPDFSVVDPSGSQIQLSDFRGQPVLLNIWASWCPPCRAEMPAMEQVYQDYREQGFVVLAVNSTHQDDQSAAAEFYEQLGLSFGLLFDFDGSVTRAYQVRSLPTSYFISPDGIIREIVIGGPMAEALLVTRVENLLGGDY